MLKFHIPIDPHQTHHAEIGEFVVRWGWIENQTTVLVRILLRIEKADSWIAIADIPIKARMNVLGTLASEILGKHPAIQADIAALLGRIEKIRNFRNSIAHCLLVHVPDKNGKLAIAVRDDSSGRTQLAPSVDKITHLPRKIGELREAQVEAQRITTALKALHGKFQ